MVMLKPHWLHEAERNERKAYLQYRGLGTPAAKDVWEHCCAILDLARSRYRRLVIEMYNAKVPS